MKKKPTPPDLSKLSEAEKDTMILTLLERLALLEQAVYKDSHNSSKPPSSDGLNKKTTSLRQSSGKPVSGQVGHKGTNLKQVAQATQIITHPLPSHCLRCQHRLPQDGGQVVERRQVLDIPLIACEVIEHHALEYVCQCGQVHTSTFPEKVTEAVQYGPNIRALGVHLTQGQLLPFARATQLIHDLYGIAISPGTLVNWVAQASTILRSSADLIARHLHQASLLHADESGLRVGGKLQWLHIVATESLTWYGVHPKRGMEAIQAHGILPNRLGVLVHDCWAPYWQLDCDHALCNAHILRELVYAKETTGQAWSEKMMNFLLNAHQLCEAAKERGVVFNHDDVAAFATLFESILREGQQLNPPAKSPTGKRGRVKQSFAFNLLHRLRLHATAVLRFIHDPNVPFTNNLGERAVRMPKVKQKISGCFRTPEGADNFSIIRSCLDTLYKQGHGMLEVLRSAFLGEPILPASFC